MDILKYKLDNDIYIPDELKEDLQGKNICFLDIETTGLSSKYNEVILIGALCIEDGDVYISQIFADHSDEEYELLSIFEKFISIFEYIITYNGATFDIPFLRKKFQHYNIESNIATISHLDLLKLVRKNKDILKLENCRLKTVELSLGISREDTISGKESVELYREYEYDKDPHKKATILKHNYDDIYYLPQLLSIFDIVEKENVLKLDLEFKSMPIVLKLYKSNMTFKKNVLYVEGKSNSIDLPSQVYYKDKYTLNWNMLSGLFNIDFKYESGNLSTGEKCFYMDLSDSDSEIALDIIDKLNYNIPDNILLVQVGNNIIYNNIFSLVDNIISSL